MLKLLKYMKPFTLMIILAIALLYGQAMADLALPNYMSNIVNVGIQQGGSDDPLPDVLTEAVLSRINLFLSSEDQAIVDAAYEAVETNSKDYNTILETFTAIKGDNIYQLKDLTDSEKATLDPIMSKALMSYAGVLEMMSSGEDMTFNGQTLAAGSDLFVMMTMIPEEQRLAMMSANTEKLAALGDDMILQAGSAAKLTIYENMGADVDKIRTNYILMTGLIMLGIALLGAIASILVGFLAARVAAGLGRNLRERIFKKVSNFSNAEMDSFSTASLITRSTNDITQIQNLMVIMIRMVFYAPIIGTGGIILALQRNSSMTWIIGLAVGTLIIMIIGVFIIAMPKFRIVQKLVDRVNLVMRENLTGMMVIRAFNTQSFEENRFDVANNDLTKNTLFVSRVMVFLMPVMMLIMNGVSLLIVWVGAHEIANATMQVGDMMAFMQYAMQIIFAFLMMSMMFIMIPRASVAAGRIVEVLNTETIIHDPKDPNEFNHDVKGTIEFKNVSFRYPKAEENMLKNVSFTAEPGKTTAIIGSTGSGKTTLINMIPRFYDVTEGEILIDGMDIRTITQHDLRAQIGYIPQKASLFTGTIESNLLFAREDATAEELEEAISISQSKEFVDEKEDGMSSHISQGGANVSGGQKQRLSIARAIVKRPPIYIFDDSFSALDFKTDNALRKALKRETGDSTLLIVAQRISTIKQAEQIIVLNDGKVVGIGTHNELMRDCSTYQEIAYSQLSKEELA